MYFYVMVLSNSTYYRKDFEDINFTASIALSRFFEHITQYHQAAVLFSFNKDRAHILVQVPFTVHRFLAYEVGTRTGMGYA